MGGRVYTDMVTIGDVDVYQVSADPSGSLSARRGSLAIRNTAGVVTTYQNTDGNTAWSERGPRLLSWQDDWPEGAAQQGNTIQYKGSCIRAATLVGISVRMVSKNTQGNYTLTLTNEDTGNSMLTGVSFDMNTLVNDTLTAVGLTATVADLVIPAGGTWTLALASDNASFDGSGIYLDLLFQLN